MAENEEVTAARAALDQAKAALSDVQDRHRPLLEAAVAAGDAQTEALNQHRAAVREANDALRPVDAELEKAEGAVRTAQAKLDTLEAGSSYTEPEAQGMGG
jgi:chromosome segregation ATPase